MVFQKILFRLRATIQIRPLARRLWWQLQGAHFGQGVRVPPLLINWPHQIWIGDHCKLEPNIYLKFDGIWQLGPSIIINARNFVGHNCEFNVRWDCTSQTKPSIVIGERNYIGHSCDFNIHIGLKIGNDCLIASGCKFIDHNHGTAIGELMNVQEGKKSEIVMEDNIWLGTNVTVLKGVNIKSGAIIGAGAVLTKSVGVNEIWAGVPARKIGQRS